MNTRVLVEPIPSPDLLDRRPARSIRSFFRGVFGPVLALLLGTVALLAISPGLLRPVFPISVLAVGYFFYKRNESHFLSFFLWILMLSPLLRRLVDWRTTYQEPSAILLAPLLLSLLPILGFRRKLEAATPRVRMVAMLTLAGILFGAGIGIIKDPNAGVLQATLTWSAPVVLFVFCSSIRNTDELSRVLDRTLLWGVLLMSAYGIYQFIVAPEWDVYWLRQISADALAPSFGQPEPFAIRVWSTMNAPGPFSIVLSAGLVWLAIRQRSLAVFASILGFAALLLTLVRSTWLTTALALVLIFAASRFRPPLKLIASLLILAAVLSLALTSLPQAADIRDRINTFSALRTDGSAEERRDMYDYVGGRIESSPIGAGLDTNDVVHNFPLDSSLLLLFYRLGWVGAAFYLSGLAILLGSMVLNFRSISPEQVASAAIALAAATQIVSGDIVYRQGGIVLWVFGGLWMVFAARARQNAQLASLSAQRVARF